MPRIFAYIVHKAGVADDSAAELLAAAAKIDATQAPTAVVTGWGAELDAVCESLRASYAEIWKIANEALAYPNAELVRKALVSVLPAGSVVLVPHAHFGVDLSPGLPIKLNAAYVPDVVDIEGVEGACLEAGPPGIRRAGEHARALRYLVGRGASTSGRARSSRWRACCRRAWSWTSPIDVGDSDGADGAISRRSWPKRAMWISPSTRFWSRSAAASRSRRTWPSPRSWPTRWAPR